MSLVEVTVTASAYWKDDSGTQIVTFASVEPILDLGVDIDGLARKRYRMGPANTYFVYVPEKMRNVLIPHGRATLRVTDGYYVQMSYVPPEDVPVKTAAYHIDELKDEVNQLQDKINSMEDEMAKLKESVTYLLNRIDELEGKTADE